MAAFRIAVLSDLHIDTEVSPASWELACRALKSALRSRVDHVVLAGDTFDCATAMLRDREVLQDHLEGLGLWQRDRLTVIVGNHDVHHTPHHGSLGQKAFEVAKVLTANNAALLAKFSAWADQLSDARDCLWARAAFPIRKQLGHVALYAVDTTCSETLRSGQGYWCPRDDHRLRVATVARAERRILAMHHVPMPSRGLRVKNLLRAHLPLGFPAPSLARLSSFVDDASIDAVVCGHLHSTREYQREIGESRVPAYIVGRTGGLHGTAPIFGLMTVPRQGRVTWAERMV